MKILTDLAWRILQADAKIQKDGITSGKLAGGCTGMAGKLTDTERGMPLWMLMNPEIEELKRRTDALEKRAEALEKEIVLLVWAIAAAAAVVAAVLLVCM